MPVQSASSTRPRCTSRARASTTPTTAREAPQPRARALGRATAPTSTTPRRPRRAPTSAAKADAGHRARRPRPTSSEAPGAAKPDKPGRQEGREGRSAQPREEALHLAAPLLVGDRQPAPPSGSVVAPLGLRTASAPSPDAQIAREDAQQRRAAHVRARSPWARSRRSNGRRMNADGRSTPRLHRGEDLLLAPRAGQVVLARVAEVVARAGERERLLAVDVRRARRAGAA